MVQAIACVTRLCARVDKIPHYHAGEKVLQMWGFFSCKKQKKKTIPTPSTIERVLLFNIDSDVLLILFTLLSDALD